ncbi:ATP-binding protein [Streptomyces sp. NPDC001820]|uniref:ATP-binding protein n=1 Tax=Streptomyces sp. NPDC001820 TaxID=3364613 RepID=UPI0036CC9450
MPCQPESARKARALVAVALSAWGLDALADAAKLVVSELVGNAVRHTGCHSIRVTLTRLEDNCVRVAVIDKSVKKVVSRTAAADDEHGRGLTVVDALAENTGTDTFTWGKRLWAQLRVPAADFPP